MNMQPSLKYWYSLFSQNFEQFYKEIQYKTVQSFVNIL